MAVEFDSQRTQDRPLELTPLIDVIFQLLVFFMLSSHFIEPSLELVLPQLEAEGMHEIPHLMIHLDDRGELFLNEQHLDEKFLFEALLAELKVNPSKRVFFRGDKGVPYEKVLTIMQQATEAGAEQFNFIYEP